MIKRILTGVGLTIGFMAYGQFTDPERQALLVKNLMKKNPGFESGIIATTNSGSGTRASVTTAANVGEGKTSLSWDASAASDTLSLESVTIPAGLYARNCLAEMLTKGGDGDLIFRITDRTNTLASETMQATSTFVKRSVSFVCPSSGSLQIKIFSTAGTAAIVYLDSAFVGENYRVGTSAQAEFIGSAKWDGTTNCIWGGTDATFTDTAADTDCPNPTVTGLITANASKIPGFNLNNAGPGHYKVILSGGNFDASSATNLCSWQIQEDTTGVVGGHLASEVNSGGAVSQRGSLVADINTTVGGNYVFRLQHRRESGAGTCQLSVNNDQWGDLYMYLYKYPSSSETAYQPELHSWFVDVNIGGSANVSLGTGNQSTYVNMGNGNLDLVQNPGSLSTMIACDGTNVATGLTCSSGNEIVGVVFTLPRAGSVRACFSGAAALGLAATSSGGPTFQVVETADGSTTAIQEGNGRYDLFLSNPAASGITQNIPIEVCGILQFSSAGKKAVKLFYEQNTASGSITASEIQTDRNGARGQRDIHVTIRPIDQQMLAPIIVNSVVNPRDAVTRIAGASLNCDAGSTINSQDGSWVSSIGNISSGACAVTLVTGTFSAAPFCWLTSVSTALIPAVTVSSATSVSILMTDNAGTASTGYDAHLLCTGAR